MLRKIVWSLTLLCAVLLLGMARAGQAQSTGTVVAQGSFLYHNVYGQVDLSGGTINGYARGSLSLIVANTRVNATITQVNWISANAVRVYALTGGYPGILEIDLTMNGNVRTIGFRETNRLTGALVFESGRNPDGTPLALALLGPCMTILPPAPASNPN